jgi:hypothetical protein
MKLVVKSAVVKPMPKKNKKKTAIVAGMKVAIVAGM